MDAEIFEQLLVVGRRIAISLESIADSQRLQLKLAAAQVNATVEQVRDAVLEEAAPEAPASAEGKKPAGKPAATDILQLLVQDPDEIDLMHRAHAHAEKTMGRGQVPADLDLYAYAAENDIQAEPRPQIDEPYSNVPPVAVE